jgi:hypothetical protein
MVIVCRGTNGTETINFLEYIESSGAQWIDTGFKPNDDTRIVIDGTAKIYDNGNLVRDYFPAKDSNGSVCLYDLVSRQYAYNAGNGEFIAGPEV